MTIFGEKWEPMRWQLRQKCTEVMNMKRICSVMLAFLLCCAGCAAVAEESGRIDDRLFNTAKQALHCLDVGDYQTASAQVGCADIDALKSLVDDQFTMLGFGQAQTRISVAYFREQTWYLAVPVMEPASADVEALLLNCGDGSDVNSVGCALWGDVQSALDSAEAVIWNEEYTSGVVVIGN